MHRDGKFDDKLVENRYLNTYAQDVKEYGQRHGPGYTSINHKKTFPFVSLDDTLGDLQADSKGGSITPDIYIYI